MSSWHDGKEAIEGYWTWAAALGFLGACLRWLRPKRLLPSVRGLLVYLTAIREYETAVATAVFWQQEAEREKESGLRWKARYETCQSEQADPNRRTPPSAPTADSDGGSG